jgi:hypothetical protein
MVFYHAFPLQSVAGISQIYRQRRGSGNHLVICLWCSSRSVLQATIERSCLSECTCSDSMTVVLSECLGQSRVRGQLYAYSVPQVLLLEYTVFRLDRLSSCIVQWLVMANRRWYGQTGGCLLPSCFACWCSSLLVLCFRNDLLVEESRVPCQVILLSVSSLWSPWPKVCPQCRSV